MLTSTNDSLSLGCAWRAQGQVIRKAVTKATTALTRCRVGGHFLTAEEIAEADARLLALEGSSRRQHAGPAEDRQKTTAGNDSSKLSGLQTLPGAAAGARRNSAALSGPRTPQQPAVQQQQRAISGPAVRARASMNGPPGERARHHIEHHRPNTVGAFD